jgi:hypothetical protein
VNKPIAYLVIAIVALSILVSVGPTLVALAHAAVPLIVAVGIVVVVLRLVFFHTRNW